MDRKLSIKKERLAELTTDELVLVAGAAPDQQQSALCSLTGCNSQKFCTTAISCGCPPTYWLQTLACD